MKISGLSFQAGIFYMGEGHLSCAYHDKNGHLHSWVKPLNGKSCVRAGQLVIRSAPLWFKLLLVSVIGFILVPKLSVFAWNGLPYYTFFYLLFGTHFLFPSSLKQYHGAEHKIFSTKGRINRSRLAAIKRATIKNRGCSTGLVVVYFLSVCLVTLFLNMWLVFNEALMFSSYVALIVVYFYHLYHWKKWMKWPERLVLAVSYWLQVHVTTQQPDRKHLLCAIESYETLGYTIFSEKLINKRLKRNKKEGPKMAIADVTIIPIGTNTPSVSSYVAEVQRVLEQYKTKGQISYELTPMSTLIEAELPILFEVIQTVHEVPFNHGVARVATNIRIDDRRDKVSTLRGKLEAVERKMSVDKKDD